MVFALVASSGLGCSKPPTPVHGALETVTVAAPQSTPARPGKIDIDPMFVSDASADSGVAEPWPAAPAPSATEDVPAVASTVRFGAVTVAAPRTADIVQQQLLTRVAPLKRCHEQISESGGKLNANIRVRLYVSAHGSVNSAQIIQQSAPLDAKMLTCTLDTLRATKFSAAVGGVTEISFPVHFSAHP
jgi:hypothetical protein